MNLFKTWFKDFQKFEGNKVLFWAGRMSMAITMIENSNALNLSNNIDLALKCRNRYDAMILKQMKEKTNEI